MEIPHIDQQLGPAVAYLAALLRGGHSFAQIAALMAEDGPQPLASVFRRFTDDLRAGVDSATALGDLQRRFPSPYLDRVIGAILRQRRVGGDLAAILEPLGAAICERVGSEGATTAQRARLAQLDGVAVDWAACEPVPPRPWAPAPPMRTLLEDPEISDVLVDGPYRIDVVRRGRLETVDARFLDDTELQEWVRGVITPLGYQIDEARPVLNLRLSDDSLMAIVAPPVSPAGTAVVLRKPIRQGLGAEDLLRFGSMSEEILEFLRACVVSRINIVVAGGTSSGKTTLMNVLCEMIPEEERVITVEATRELRFRRRRLLALETGQTQAGRGVLSVAELIEQALLMVPERIIVGELRGAEVLPLAQSMNNGHNGSMASMHATSPHDALVRLEQLATMAEPAIPLRAVRHELASALQLIVQHNRLADGRRRVVSIAEVAGMEGEALALREIFRFEPSEGGGTFVATGHRPAFLGQLAGYALPDPDPQDGARPPAHAIEDQLAETTALMAALLRAGYSFVQALGILAEELPGPVGDALGAAARAIGAGEPISEALAAMARAGRSPALQLLADTIIRQRREGSSLADGLEALVERLRGSAGDDASIHAVSERLRAHYGLPPHTS